MSFRRDNAAKQTAFRLAALENGYTPTPNHHKHCYLKGWGELKPTVEMIQSWRGQLVYQATGLLVKDGLCALDMDIDDADLVSDIWNTLVKQHPQMREALIRSGAGAKEMWLCRCDEIFKAVFSTSHVKPGVDPEEEDAKVFRFEAFGGGYARQIGAFGAHTLRDDGNGFEIEYTWEGGDSPAEVRLDALPLLPKAAVLWLSDLVSEKLEKAGWPRAKGRSGESNAETIYDLLPTMRFDCNDGTSRTLDQLADFGLTSGARCSASWQGNAQFRNRTRCLVHTDHDGVVAVLELANWERHMPASEAERARPLGDKIADLAAKMVEKGFEFDHDTYHDAPAAFQDRVQSLFENWAWCGSRAAQCLPISRAEEFGMSLTNLRLTNLQWAYERVGPKGGVVKINPVDAWITSSQRQDVDGYRFRPDRPPGIYSDIDGAMAINSYRAPVHDNVSDGPEYDKHAQLWVDFLTHLLPDAQEREWFMDWLAFKRQNLTMPGVAVIMFASRYGVGRGSLFEFLGAVLGDQYVNNVTADMLMNTSSQGQYTDWLANCLLITTDEILPDGDEGSALSWRRKKAYEKLKERIDPKPRRVDIIRKTLPNYQDWVYASFIMATNHDNAIPIPEGDRRLVVLTNGRRALAEDAVLMRRVNAVRNPSLDRRFIATVDRWLSLRDVSHFNSQVAPDFKGKTRMQEANVTELENVIDSVIEHLPLDWVTLNVLLSRVEEALLRQGVRDEFPHWRRAATDQLKQQWHYVGRYYIGSRTAKHMVYARDGGAEEHFAGLSPNDRQTALAEMSKSGAAPSSAVVALRRGLSQV